MTTAENRRELGRAEGFDDVFALVKKATEQALGKHRAGLTLVLGDLSNDVGAYHEMGSNAIVMNRNLLKMVRQLSKTKTTKNAYVFMILLHEYLHSLGYADDRQVRRATKSITEEFLGDGHIAAEMAVKPLDQFFPELRNYVGFRDKGEYETVRKFDSSSTPYIA